MTNLEFIQIKKAINCESIVHMLKVFFFSIILYIGTKLLFNMDPLLLIFEVSTIIKDIIWAIIFFLFLKSTFKSLIMLIKLEKNIRKLKKFYCQCMETEEAIEKLKIVPEIKVQPIIMEE